MNRYTTNGLWLAPGNTKLRYPQFSELLGWQHCWDWADPAATTYVDGSSITRYASIPDRGAGGFPLLRDTGPYGATFSTTALPGQKFIGAATRFNGRPAGRCDAVAGSVAPFAMLTPNANPGNSATFFNGGSGYAVPYWVVALACPSFVGVDSRAAIWDGTQGTPGTVPTTEAGGFAAGANWQWSNFGPSQTFGTVAHAASVNETVLLIVSLQSGANAFMEVNWRNAGGDLQTLRSTTTMNTYAGLECFFGYVHGFYITLAGLMLGTPTTNQTDTIRNFCAAFIPNAGVLADQ